MNGLKRTRLWAAFVLVAAVTAGIAAPGHRGLVVSAAIIALLAEALVEVARAGRTAAAATPIEWERLRRRATPPPQRPSDLERLERALGWGRYSTSDFNHQVRPLLRGLVASRLRERHGVDLEVDGSAAEALVSPDLWRTIVLAADPSEGRVFQTGDVKRLVDEVEAL